jgi:Family of unknown function (DUF6326)
MMDSTQTGPADLADANVDVKTKISALWAAVMFCYIYGDVFGLLKPGAIEAIVAGKAGPSGPMAQWVLVAMAASMAIPSVMVFLSLALKPKVNRYANITLGVAYTLIILVTMYDAWMFYAFLGVVEAVMTLLIAWYAWSWPRDEAAQGTART